jgi:hypothetical protein
MFPILLQCLLNLPGQSLPIHDILLLLILLLLLHIPCTPLLLLLLPDIHLVLLTRLLLLLHIPLPPSPPPDISGAVHPPTNP